MVKVENMKIMTNTGGLKAFVDIAIDLGIWGRIKMRSCRIVQNQSSKPFFLPPQSQYQDNEGKNRYATIIRFEGTIKDEVEKVALQAYLEQLKGGSNGERETSFYKE